jgi:hypothetical protein
MSAFGPHLRAAVRTLPGDLRIWMNRAFNSGWFDIGPGAYDGGPGGSVCPVVAAAKLAGAWDGDGMKPGWKTWGTPDEPSASVEDFAAYFDLFSSEAGVKAAVETVRSALDEDQAAKAA